MYIVTTSEFNHFSGTIPEHNEKVKVIASGRDGSVDRDLSNLG